MEQKLYSSSDMVRVGCHDCVGCSACCRNMGQSILLDPYDVYLLTGNLGQTFEQLLGGAIELHMEQGLILPNLRMVPENLSCSFLNEEGRCSIHEFRPGICRLFPLGRNYEPDRLQYFLLADACPAKNKSKMKIDKWIGHADVRQYEKYLVIWHNLTKKLRGELEANLKNADNEEALAEQEAYNKKITMAFLQLFYMKPYTQENFYTEFYERVQLAEGFV